MSTMKRELESHLTATRIRFYCSAQDACIALERDQQSGSSNNATTAEFLKIDIQAKLVSPVN